MITKKLFKYSGLLLLLLTSCKQLRFSFKSEGKTDGIFQDFEKPKKNAPVTPKIKAVVFVHGMGQKDQNYSYLMLNNLAKFHFKGHYQIIKDISFHTKDTFKTHLEKFKAFDKNKDTILFYSIRYSNKSDSIKIKMKKNEMIENKRRNGIPRFAKNGFIDQFKDVMLVQEKNISDTITIMFNESLSDFVKHKNFDKDSSCINFITASLGTAVTARYLRSIYLLKKEKDVDDSLSYADMHQMNSISNDKNYRKILSIKNFRIYQLTNQLDLFGESIKNWGNPSTFQGYQDELNEFKMNSNKRLIQSNDNKMVLKSYSFRHPNDLLCFYVKPSFYKTHFDIKSNDPEYKDIDNVVNIHYRNILRKNNLIVAHVFVYSSRRLAKKIVSGITD
jgi:hypothetical protein